jgi:small basic protein (TIGR04137 family)
MQCHNAHEDKENKRFAFGPRHGMKTGRSRKGRPESIFNFMSQHRSLRATSTLGAKRNVMKRFERVEVLRKRGQWKAGDRVTGLRKTKPEA